MGEVNKMKTSISNENTDLSGLKANLRANESNEAHEIHRAKVLTSMRSAGEIVFECILPRTYEIKCDGCTIEGTFTHEDLLNYIDYLIKIGSESIVIISTGFATGKI